MTLFSYGFVFMGGFITALAIVKADVGAGMIALACLGWAASCANWRKE
jgi:hypothetical protein